MKINFKYISIILILLVSCFLIFQINVKGYLNSFFDKEDKLFIKKYFLPYRMISQQTKEIDAYKELFESNRQYLLNLELDIIESGNDITFKETNIRLSNDMYLNKYKLTSGFYSGITLYFPGSGYLDFHEDNLFIMSSRGLIAYKENIYNDDKKLNQIKSNIDQFIGLEQFKKYKDASIKDLTIIKDKIFVSYTEEIKENCWNTSIIFAEINYQKILFKKLFSNKECIHSEHNQDNEFTPGQAGGRIFVFDDDNILFSVGDYRSRHLAQDKKSINGKLLKINFKNGNLNIISMGHRNPQGLYFDKENNFILETEHGPNGGDEVNLVDLNKINQNQVPNYGWPIASYGEHYKNNKDTYDKYPLYKSHSDYGFIEPLIKFDSSIAASEIVKINNNQYVFGSMGKSGEGYKSLYFFDLDNEKNVTNLEQVKLHERIRDLKFKDNKLFLFLENTASLGIIDLNKN